MPVDVRDDTNIEDFYTKLLQLIDSGNQAKALEMLDNLKTEDERLGILSQFANNLSHDLFRARDRVRDFDLDRLTARELDIAFFHASTRARDLVLVLDHALDLARAVDRALDLARDRDLVLVLDLDLVRDRTRFLIAALGGKEKFAVENQAKVQVSPSLILEGIETLTADHLSSTVSPYLKAVVELQRTIASLQKIDFVEPRITMISQNSPLGIEMTGVADAIKAIQDIIVPWRRKHAQEMAELEEQQKRAAIAQAEAEIQRLRIETAQKRQATKIVDEQTSVDLEQKKLQAEQLHLANEEKRLDIARKKIELAISVIEQVAPNLPDKERIEYVTRMLPALNVLVESPLEPKDGNAS